jgi:hypothetical protein
MPNQNNKTDTREELREYRQGLVEQVQQHSESFDKTIITIASSSLGISVAFLKDIVPEPNKWTIPLLVLSWLLLSVSLAAIVFSMLMAIWGRKDMINQIDKTLISDNPGPKWKSSTTALTLSWISAISLVLGIFFYLLFAIINISL